MVKRVRFVIDKDRGKKSNGLGELDVIPIQSEAFSVLRMYTIKGRRYLILSISERERETSIVIHFSIYLLLVQLSLCRLY